MELQKEYYDLHQSFQNQEELLGNCAQIPLKFVIQFPVDNIKPLVWMKVAWKVSSAEMDRLRSHSKGWLRVPGWKARDLSQVWGKAY